MRKFLKPRAVFILLTLVAICGVASSFYAQYVLMLQPCPLCVFQRVGVMGVGIVSMFFALFMPSKKWLIVFANLCVSVVALLGLGVSLRHLWIQSLPPSDIPVCGPGLNFMLQNMPITQVLDKVLYGSGECAVVSRLFGIPLPLWSLVFFSCVLIFIWGAWFMVGRKSK